MGCSKLAEAEMRIIRKMQDDETYYEGERRHCPVDRDDPAVKGKCNEIIMLHIDQIEEEAVKDCISREDKCRKCLKCLKKIT